MPSTPVCCCGQLQCLHKCFVQISQLSLSHCSKGICLLSACHLHNWGNRKVVKALGLHWIAAKPAIRNYAFKRIDTACRGFEDHIPAWGWAVGAQQGPANWSSPTESPGELRLEQHLWVKVKKTDKMLLSPQVVTLLSLCDKEGGLHQNSKNASAIPLATTPALNISWCLQNIFFWVFPEAFKIRQQVALCQQWDQGKRDMLEVLEAVIPSHWRNHNQWAN